MEGLFYTYKPNRQHKTLVDYLKGGYLMEEIRDVYGTTEFKAVIDYYWRLHILDLWGENKRGMTVTNALPSLVKYIIRDDEDFRKLTGVTLYGTDCEVMEYGGNGEFKRVTIKEQVLPDGRKERQSNQLVHYPFYDEMKVLYGRDDNGLC